MEFLEEVKTMEVKVETYKSRRSMESGLNKLLNADWSLLAQSGTLTRNPWSAFMSGQKVTCTLTRHNA